MGIGLDGTDSASGIAELPAMAVAPFATALLSAAGSPATDPDEGFGSLFSSGATILVVDDEPLVLEIVVEMLEGLGYDVLSADGLEQALEVTEGSPAIDLLLSDVMMPGANGPIVAARLRQRYPDLTVVFMSGYTADVVIGQHVDASKMLAKPFTIQDLADIVSSALGGR